ncbi:MAG TPA: FAD/NAD(P)-binding protein, partial [Solirubrobacteraceae bacterium]
MLDQLSPPAGPRPGGQGLRVAIVGLGPKGMFALERLLDHAARADGGVPIEVDAFEPHPVPGAGPVYDPGQPAHLRMNFAAGAVDMWWPGSRAAPPAERRSFVDWCAARGAPCDAAGYPPRATVGRYLADGLRTLLAHAPPNVTVTVHPTRVQAVRRVGSAWDLALAGHSPGTDRSPAPAGPGRYDEVLLATGHDDSWDGALANGWGGPARLAAGVFPVDRWLTAERIPAGATVAVRGFALSFIDAALALTEGRGGSFEPRDDDRRGRPEGGRLPLPEACRLAYRPGSDDVGVILPFSRTGRPMLAKPAAGLARSIPGLDELARRGRRRLSGLDEPVSLCGDLLPILAAVARANLRAASAAPEHAAGVDSWLDAATAGLPAAGDHGPADELRQSLAIGAGLIAPDLQWALGQTWRTLYPALVERLGGDRLAS